MNKDILKVEVKRGQIFALIKLYLQLCYSYMSQNGWAQIDISYKIINKTQS